MVTIETFFSRSWVRWVILKLEASFAAAIRSSSVARQI